jgi:hypothetical protein
VNFKFPESVDDKGSAYRVSVRRPDGKSPLRRPRRRWEDNIKNGSLRSGIDWNGLD